MKAVLLCGGEGVRLRPLTCDRPKPMLPLLGRPLLEYTLRHLASHGVRRAYLTLGYLPEKVMEIAAVRDLPLELDFYTEDSPLGTAGSVAHAARDMDEPFFVISGDTLTDVDLTSVLSFHRSSGALCTCVLHRESEISRYGVAVCDDHGRILKFQEKPHISEAESFSVNTGIYVLNPEVLSLIPKDRPYDFASDLFPELVRQGKLYGFGSEAYWSDIGSPDAYLRSQEDLMMDRVHFSFPQGRPEPISTAASAVIDPSAVLKPPVWIGDFCRIGKGCVIGPGTVLERNCVVGDRSGVKGCLIGENACLERNVQLRRMIAGPETHLCEDSRAFEGSILGTGARLGGMSTLCAKTRVWPGKRTKDHAMITQDLVFGNPGRESLFEEGRIQGVFGRDLPVSYLSRLALAVCACLPKGARVALAVCDQKVANTAAQIFTAAFNEQSLHVIRVENGSLSMLRDAVPSMKLHAGLWIQSSGRNLRVDVIDESGFPPDPSALRRMEDSLERMGENVCAGDVGTSLVMNGVSRAYARKLRRWTAGCDRIRIAVEGNGNPDSYDMGSLPLIPVPEKEALFTVCLNENDWTWKDERGHRLTAGEKTGALFLAGLQTGILYGNWPIPADAWSRDLQAEAIRCGVSFQRVSSRSELWIRALKREGHSAKIHDAGFFFDPFLASCVLARVETLRSIPFSQWYPKREPDSEVQGHYDEIKAYDVMQKLRSLRAEAAQEFEGGCLLGEEDELVLEWGGRECMLRIHGSSGDQRRMRNLLDSILR